MRKLAVLGFLLLLLLGAGVFVAVRFPIACLFVPCDRSVRFVLQPPEQALDGCELLLFAADDDSLSELLHRLAIQDHEAEVIVQPRWNESFRAALGCKGLRLSAPQLVNYEHKSSVTLSLRKPGA